MTPQIVYAIIDLGSSYIRGLVANKLETGEVSPIACESIPTEGCIRHGAVYNIDETAEKIRAILSLLNERLEENLVIKRLYVGLSALSLRSEEETISLELSDEGEEITKEHILQIEKKVRKIQYPRRVIIDYLPPYYEIDGRIEPFPRSIVCHQFTAHISLITVKDWIYNNVKTVIEDRLGLELVGVLPSPLYEANVMLSTSQRQLGSVFVNVGGGCSSVVIFHNGVFRRLRVLPFGGQNVTKDLENLNLTQEEAESIKKQYAGATTYADRDKTFEIPSFDGIGMRTMRVLDLNRYTSARMREITENIFEVVRIAGLDHHVNAGYLFTGGASKLKRFDELLRNYTRHFTFNTQIASILDHNNALVTVAGMETALALAYVAEENCIGADAEDLSSLIQRNEIKADESIRSTPLKEEKSGSPRQGKTISPSPSKAKIDSENIQTNGDRFSNLLEEDEDLDWDDFDEEDDFDDKKQKEKATKKNPSKRKLGRLFTNLWEAFKEEPNDDEDEL